MRLEQETADTPVHGLFSPEGVRLELPVAGPAPRMLAYGIDMIFIAILLLLLFLALVTSLPIGKVVEKWFSSTFRHAMRDVRAGNGGTPEIDPVFGMILALFILVQFAVETGYFIFWEMVANGRSPGKRALGLRVVRRGGLPLDLRSSVVRNLMRIVDLLPANYCVGLASILLSPQCERLGDHVAGTIVIRLDRPEAAEDLAAQDAAQALALTREQLARIGSRELQLVRGTLRRLSDLPEDRSEPLLLEVSEAMRTRLGLEELPTPDRLSFLRELLQVAERYSRKAR